MVSRLSLLFDKVVRNRTGLSNYLARIRSYQMSCCPVKKRFSIPYLSLEASKHFDSKRSQAAIVAQKVTTQVTTKHYLVSMDLVVTAV